MQANRTSTHIVPAQLRAALGNYPTGVTVVTARAANADAVGVTANSFSSLSLEPPLVTWALDLRSASLQAFTNAAHFCINFLSEEQGALAMRFAKRSADKFAGTALLTAQNLKAMNLPKSTPPLLAQSAGWLLCQKAQQIDLGDHRLFVGRVIALSKQEPAPSPLAFHRGQLTRIAQTNSPSTPLDLVSPQFTDDYLAYLLARASHSVSAEFHATVAKSGLTVAQWRVLASLSPKLRLSVGELAKRVLAKQPTLTKLLDRMQEDGLVKRLSAQDDARKTVVALTAKGAKKVQSLLLLSKEHEAQIASTLGKAPLADLKHDLRALIARYNQPIE